MGQNFQTICLRVAALDIENAELKSILAEIARAVDDGYSSYPTDPDLIRLAERFRDAGDALGKHVHERSASKLAVRGVALGADAEFRQFESLRDGTDRAALQKARAKFQNLGAEAHHNLTRVVVAKRIENALDSLIEYVELWIEKFAPDLERKASAYKDPHLDAIAAYRQHAQARLTELMGTAPPDCYLQRKAEFEPPQDKAEPDPDLDPLGLDAAAQEQFARDAALLDQADPAEVLKTHHRSLLLAHAGSGKSLEAARLAVELTRADGVAPLACCIVLQCHFLERSTAPIDGGFTPIKQFEIDTFRTFCALRGWKRYLILDGFDEINWKQWTSDHFNRAVTAFQDSHSDVHVLITSRRVTAVSSTFFSSWKAFKLLDLDGPSVASYLLARLKHKPALLRSIADQLDALDKHESIRSLLMRPFFLCAFAETVTETDLLREMQRCQLVERFVLELLARQFSKVKLELTLTAREKALTELGQHAFSLIIGGANPEGGVVADLANRDLLLRPGDMQFKQGEVRDFLAAHFLFHNATDANELFKRLRALEGEQRFTFHGWLLELVNQETLDPPNKRHVLNRLWRDDPILVALGLHNEAQLKRLDLPLRPWEPYESGLLKIMRGEDAATISECTEIRDLRLSSPGEKLLHRMRHPDLPYAIRAVPGRRAVSRLEVTLTSVADPWAELIEPLASIVQDWLASQSPLHGIAYGTPKQQTVLAHLGDIATVAASPGVDSEVLVRVLLMLADLRAKVGWDRATVDEINVAIQMLRPTVFNRPLSAKQLHRLLVTETKYRDMAGGGGQDPGLASRILGLIYEGAVDKTPQLGSLRMKSLIMELPRLSGFGDKEKAQTFAEGLWAQIVADWKVAEVPPTTLAQALYMEFESPQYLESTGRLAKWLDYWLERISPFEAVLLQARGISFPRVPPGFVDAEGWIQARDALRQLDGRVPRELALPMVEYTPEQKQHWIATATQGELIDLLLHRVVDRATTKPIFNNAVRRLVESSQPYIQLSPRHWWELVRRQIVKVEEIGDTVKALEDQVESSPVAYELLDSAGARDQTPSEAVVDLATQSVNCPLDTRVRLVSSRRISIDQCWEAEKTYLNEVRQLLANERPVKGPNRSNIPLQRGGLLHGIYTLVFHCDGEAADKIWFCHPAFESAINFRTQWTTSKIAKKSLDWRDGEVVMGFLWLIPAALAPRRFTVTDHKMGYRVTGYVYQNDQLNFAPLYRDNRNAPAKQPN